MQRISTIAKRTGQAASRCERAITRSFSEAAPEVPRKQAKPAIPRKNGGAAIPRKASGGEKLSTRMNNKVAYPLYTVGGVCVGLGVYELFRMSKSDTSFITQLKDDITSIKDSIIGYKHNFTEITTTDLPACRMGPDDKPLRTLIIDLEDTLIAEEWDAMNGERQIRRPGVDKMLMYLSSMYEIFIISDKNALTAMELMSGVDKNHVCSGYLYSESMKLRNGTRVKDISVFDRDPKRVIVLDNNRNANEHKENVITVKPFENSKKVRDTTLLDIIPLLEEIYLNDEDDVREYIKQLGDDDGVTGYHKMQERREQAEKEERQKAFLQQINIFKPAENDEDSNSSILLADPELEGLSPALAANNMEKMMQAGTGQFLSSDVKVDHLKHIPVEVNGEKPEGFTTYWQREYLKKHETMQAQQERMMQMQSIAMQHMNEGEMA